MDELIILLVRALSNWLGGDSTAKKKSGRPVPPARPVAGQSGSNLPPQTQQLMRQRTQGMQRTPPGRAVPGRRRSGAAGRAAVVMQRPPQAAPVQAAPEVQATPPSMPRQAAAPQQQARPATAAPAPASVNAATIRRWATPSVLQKQFILTEIFQPPLALRRPDSVL
jgi:hypothetical protein